MAVRRIQCVVPVLVLVGCVTVEVQPERVAPQVLQQHEQRLIAPFNRGNTVLCQTLSVAVNPVFFKHVMKPAGVGKTTRGDGFEETSWHVLDRPTFRASRRGGGPTMLSLPKHLKIQIGTTWFLVDDHIRIRLLHKAPPTLTALARGHVMVTKDGNSADRFEEVRFADGSVKSR